MNGTEDLTAYLWIQELGYVRKGMSWEERKACYDLKKDIENEMVEAGYDIDYINDSLTDKHVTRDNAWAMCLTDYVHFHSYNPFI